MPRPATDRQPGSGMPIPLRITRTSTRLDQPPPTPRTLRGQDLRRSSVLAGQDLRHVDLTGADLRGADHRRAIHLHVVLVGLVDPHRYGQHRTLLDSDKDVVADNVTIPRP